MTGGHIVGTRTIVNHGNPANRFDIVILGEGFQAQELLRFDQRAKSLAGGLLKLQPFKKLANLINVHTVRTVSTNSGVSNFPEPNVPQQTFYNVSGFFEIEGGGSPASFFGTKTPAKILNAAGLVAPLQHLQLFIVLVNAKGFGASAFPEQRTVFTALQRNDKEFVHITAHECCHAIARTAEEYLDCDPPRHGTIYPNQVTEAERLAGAVKWKGLAKARELNAAGDFKAVHKFGDKDVRFELFQQTPIFSKTSLNGMLGLYSGCQDVDPSFPGNCDSYHDPGGSGRHFYRAMASCKMRFASSPFCRVCSHELVKQIQAFAH